jgi:hypothetical protein
MSCQDLVHEASSVGLRVEVEPVDLASATEADFNRIVMAHCGEADHSVAMIVHNAGTIGQVIWNVLLI